MEHQFNIPSRVLFGPGSSKQIGDIVKDFRVSNVLLIYDKGVKNAGIVASIQASLEEAGLNITEYDGVLPNPPDIIVEEAAENARKAKVDAIVAVGGGSSIDAAKAINILLTNPSPITQYDGVNMVKNATKPLIALPTTSGTGSEVTEVTVITNTTTVKKMIMVGQHIGPDLAIVDPNLTVGLPKGVTDATGMDALTHAIESYVSPKASVMTDINSLKAVELIYSNLPEASSNGSNVEARENMLMGSMLAAMAFNSALLGMVHGIAHPLSAHCGLPHGVANATTLPYVMEFNADVPVVQAKFKDIANAMGFDVSGLTDKEGSDLAIKAVKDLSKELGIPTLREAGVTKDKFDILAKDTLEEASMLTNPRTATKEDVLRILELAY